MEPACGILIDLDHAINETKRRRNFYCERKDDWNVIRATNSALLVWWTCEFIRPERVCMCERYSHLCTCSRGVLKFNLMLNLRCLFSCFHFSSLLLTQQAPLSPAPRARETPSSDLILISHVASIFDRFSASPELWAASVFFSFFVWGQLSRLDCWVLIRQAFPRESRIATNKVAQ